MNTPRRRPWIAVLLALVAQGLGHLYAGRLGAAIALHGIAIALAAGVGLGLRAGPGWATAAAAAALAFWIGQAAHAGRTASRAAPSPRRAWVRILGLVAFAATAGAVSSVAAEALRARVGQTVYVPAGSMLPTIQVGDYLAVASGRPAVLRGAVVVHEAPAGAPTPDMMVKRVVAVGGDAVEIRDGALWVNDAPVERRRGAATCAYADRPTGGAWREQPCVDFVETLDGRTFHTHCTPYLPCGDVEPQVVPAGYVWVAGDHRDHSADSRVYGPIPESTIQGEVRWVVASWGPAGLRWDRIGREIR